MLYLVPTPIGNLGDITVRALQVLREAGCVAAEDTRHTGNLLRHHGIERPLVSFHERNERRRTEEFIGRLGRGESIALATDAGTPAISDPGVRLVRACIANSLPYTVLPGASSVVVAAAGCGFGGGRFYFGGFLPVKSGQRRNELAAALERAEFSLYFESPHRIAKTLAVVGELSEGRQICIARELSKIYEEFRRGTAAELLAHFAGHPAKGEFVIAIAGKDTKPAYALKAE